MLHPTWPSVLLERSTSRGEINMPLSNVSNSQTTRNIGLHFTHFPWEWVGNPDQICASAMSAMCLQFSNHPGLVTSTLWLAAQEMLTWLAMASGNNINKGSGFPDCPLYLAKSHLNIEELHHPKSLITLLSPRLHGGGGVYLSDKDVEIGSDPFMYWQTNLADQVPS